MEHNIIIITKATTTKKNGNKNFQARNRHFLSSSDFFATATSVCDFSQNTEGNLKNNNK